MSARRMKQSTAPTSEVRATVAPKDAGPSDLDIATVALAGVKPSELHARDILLCALEAAGAEAVRLTDDLEGTTHRDFASSLMSRLEAIRMLVERRLHVEFKAGPS